jgi:hypothetical protein
VAVIIFVKAYSISYLAEEDASYDDFNKIGNLRILRYSIRLKLVEIVSSKTLFMVRVLELMVIVMMFFYENWNMFLNRNWNRYFYWNFL